MIKDNNCEPVDVVVWESKNGDLDYLEIQCKGEGDVEMWLRDRIRENTGDELQLDVIHQIFKKPILTIAPVDGYWILAYKAGDVTSLEKISSSLRNLAV